VSDPIVIQVAGLAWHVSSLAKVTLWAGIGLIATAASHAGAWIRRDDSFPAVEAYKAGPFLGPFAFAWIGVVFYNTWARRDAADPSNK
jgi:hypothetical protein